MSTTADTMETEENQTRKRRARNRYIRLVYLDEDTKATQRLKGDDWGDAHLLHTSDGTADTCSCPDCQKNGRKCYHQEAWDEWEFDEIVFSDGQEVTL